MLLVISIAANIAANSHKIPSKSLHTHPLNPIQIIFDDARQHAKPRSRGVNAVFVVTAIPAFVLQHMHQAGGTGCLQQRLAWRKLLVRKNLAMCIAKSPSSRRSACSSSYKL